MRSSSQSEPRFHPRLQIDLISRIISWHSDATFVFREHSQQRVSPVQVPVWREIVVDGQFRAVSVGGTFVAKRHGLQLPLAVAPDR